MNVWDEIAAIPRLDRETEAALGKRIAEGNSRAVTRLAEANLAVAVPIAKAICRKSGGKWEAGDMLSEATTALMQCAERWDYRSPVRFGAYARIRVRGAMLDFLRKKADTVRGSRQQAISLNAPDEEGLEAIDMLEGDAGKSKADPLSILSPRERQVAELRIIKDAPESIGSVANQLKISEDHVRRLQSRVMKKLSSLAA